MPHYGSGHTFEVMAGEVDPSDAGAAQIAPGWYAQWSEDREEGSAAGPYETEEEAAMRFLDGEPKRIAIVTLALVRDGRILLVRKRGTDHLILPGGKPEAGETQEQTLRREVMEELGCKLAPGTTRFVRTFVDDAAGSAGRVRVTVHVHASALLGTPRPLAEIEELAWEPLDAPSGRPLAPSLSRQIIPHLRASRRTAAQPPLLVAYPARALYDASLAHLGRSTVEWLGREAGMTRADDPGRVLDVGEMAYGYFMFVPTDAGDPRAAEVPPDLADLMRRSRAMGCEFLLLDRDAEPQAGLPIRCQD